MITGLGSAKDLASGRRGAFYNTLEEFHQYWDRIDVITPWVKTPLSKLFDNVYAHTCQRRSKWFYFYWFQRKALELYKEEKSKFDLMTVQEFPPFYNGILARLLWEKIKVPYILEIHHIPGYPKASSLKEKFYLFLTKNLRNYKASKAVAFRVVNKKETPNFLKRMGVPEEKIKYIPSLYINLETFRPIDVAKEYDLIFVGRLVENKGINLFLEVVKKLDAQAVIVGAGPLEKDIKEKIKTWKLKVNFHGWAKDSQEVAELINKSRILVMPSYNEGGPRVVVEAMACGVPVLATSVGIVPDVIQDKQSGVIIDWDADDIATKAKELLSNREEYERCRQAGLAMAQKFERRAAIKNYADQLKAILLNNA